MNTKLHRITVITVGIVLTLSTTSVGVWAGCPTPTPTDAPLPTPTEDFTNTEPIVMTPTPTDVPVVQPSPTPVIVLEETPLVATPPVAPTSTAEDCEDSTAVPTARPQSQRATTVPVIFLPETGGDLPWSLWGAMGAGCCVGLILVYLFAWSLCVVSKRSQERMERMEHGTDNR